MLFGQMTGLVLDPYCSPVPHRVEIKFDLFPCVIGHSDEPPCVVPSVSRPALVCANDLGDVAHGIVFKANCAGSGTQRFHPAL
ncbi:hypothetical protein D3C81_1999230 [compost metagenome]